MINTKHAVFDFDGVLAHYDGSSNQYWPDPEASAVLKVLYERGIKLFISSATHTETLQAFLDKWQWSSYFIQIFGYPIPKPHAFRQILADHTLSAKQLVMIGDSLSDYTAAVSVGIDFIGRVQRSDSRGSRFPKQTPIVYELSELINNSIA